MAAAHFTVSRLFNYIILILILVIFIVMKLSPKNTSNSAWLSYISLNTMTEATNPTYNTSRPLLSDIWHIAYCHGSFSRRISMYSHGTWHMYYSRAAGNWVKYSSVHVLSKVCFKYNYLGQDCSTCAVPHISAMKGRIKVSTIIQQPQTDQIVPKRGSSHTQFRKHQLYFLNYYKFTTK